MPLEFALSIEDRWQGVDEVLVLSSWWIVKTKGLGFVIDSLIWVEQGVFCELFP
jgi:hypothetical protein